MQIFQYFFLGGVNKKRDCLKSLFFSHSEPVSESQSPEYEILIRQLTDRMTFQDEIFYF